MKAPGGDARVDPFPTLVISPKRTALLLAGGVILLLLAALPPLLIWRATGHDYLYGWVPLAQAEFDMNGENNVPTWFSSGLLLLAASLLAIVGSVQRAGRHRYAVHWLGLAAVFLLLSADETASFHEKLINPISGALTVLGLRAGGVLGYAWVVVGAAFVLAVGIAYLGFLRALPVRTRRLFIASAVLFVGGAIGMELIGGYYHDLLGDAYLATPRHVLLSHAEESLEMSGTILFIYALLSYLKVHVGSLRVAFAEGGSERT